jgi:hypothetical protein
MTASFTLTNGIVVTPATDRDTVPNINRNGKSALLHDPT